MEPKFHLQSYRESSKFSCLSDLRLKIHLKQKSCPARFFFFQESQLYTKICRNTQHAFAQASGLDLIHSRSSKAKWRAGCRSLQTFVEACPILTGLTSSQVFLEQADSHWAKCWCSCLLSNLLSIFPEDLSSLSKAAAEKGAL